MHRVWQAVAAHAGRGHAHDPQNACTQDLESAFLVEPAICTLHLVNFGQSARADVADHPPGTVARTNSGIWQVQVARRQCFLEDDCALGCKAFEQIMAVRFCLQEPANLGQEPWLFREPLLQPALTARRRQLKCSIEHGFHLCSLARCQGVAPGQSTLSVRPQENLDQRSTSKWTALFRVNVVGLREPPNSNPNTRISC